MKFFVTGVNGQLGIEVINELTSRGHRGVGSGTHPEYCGIDLDSYRAKADYVCVDITDRARVREAIASERPDVIVHCASWTAVDLAEEESVREQVYAVNVLGTRYLAEAAAEYGCKFIYISTDYVFDGSGDTPWTPECNEFNPLNYYGQTKLDGESAVRKLLERYYIVRISWAFGINGSNFVKNILRAGQKHDEVRVVCDQIGTPTYMRDLARILVDMAESDKYGIYHVTNEGDYVSWYDFAREIYRMSGMSVRVIPVTTAEYGRSKAVRPLNSRLDRSKLVREGFKPLPDWKDALARYLNELDIDKTH